MKKLAILTVLVILISSCSSSLKGTYADLATENEIPGSVYQYIFMDDGSFTFNWKVPGLETEEEYDLDIFMKGSFLIEDDIITFTITEETSRILGQSPEADVPWTVEMQIINKNSKSIEISRMADDSSEKEDYRVIKLTRR